MFNPVKIIAVTNKLIFIMKIHILPIPHCTIFKTKKLAIKITTTNMLPNYKTQLGKNAKLREPLCLDPFKSNPWWSYRW